MEIRGEAKETHPRVSAGRPGMFKQMRREVKVLRARK